MFHAGNLYQCVRVTCCGWILVSGLWFITLGSHADDAKRQVREIDWVDLLPEEDLHALMNPPAWLLEIEDGSAEDDVSLLSSERPQSETELRFHQALRSAEVRAEFDNQQVRIPGFIVPLAFDDRRRTIEFFLVPYFGACLHLPPPPPNQIIYVNYEPGIEIELLYEPYWIEGLMRTRGVSNQVAEAAYRINAASIEIFRE